MAVVSIELYRRMVDKLGEDGASRLESDIMTALESSPNLKWILKNQSELEAIFEALLSRARVVM